jgi:hypothetical protein
LAEAREKLAEAECDAHGHRFDHVLLASGELQLVLCSICQRSWEVVERKP